MRLAIVSTHALCLLVNVRMVLFRRLSQLRYKIGQISVFYRYFDHFSLGFCAKKENRLNVRINLNVGTFFHVEISSAFKKQVRNSSKIRYSLENGKKIRQQKTFFLQSHRLLMRIDPPCSKLGFECIQTWQLAVLNLKKNQTK